MAFIIKSKHKLVKNLKKLTFKKDDVFEFVKIFETLKIASKM